MSFPGSNHVMQKAYSRFCGCQMREFIKGRRWGDVVSALCADDGLSQGIEPLERLLRSADRPQSVTIFLQTY